MSMSLSAPDRARIDKLLQRREDDLRAVIAAETHAATQEHDRAEVADFKDAAHEDARAMLEDALAARAVKELEDLAGARRRLADGTYGTCLSCGEAIDERRLHAMPAARYCTECQANFE